jgi:hypothetical protein
VSLADAVGEVLRETRHFECRFTPEATDLTGFECETAQKPPK